MQADLGADVIMVERPSGSPERRLGPFFQDSEDPAIPAPGGPTRATNAGSRLDLAGEGGRDQRRALLIESFAPGFVDAMGSATPSSPR